MDFLAWLKQSPFSTPWFDAILFGVLLFEILPFFFRARAARYGFTAGSVACQLGLLFACLFLGATLIEALVALSVAALIAAAASYIEYRVFDREETVAACAVKAEEAARIARARAEEFVLPVERPAPTASPEPERKPTEDSAPETEEGGDNAQ